MKIPTYFQQFFIITNKTSIRIRMLCLILIEITFRLGFVEEVANVKKKIEDLNRQMEKKIECRQTNGRMPDKK